MPKIDVQVSGSFRSIPGVTQQNPPNNDVNVGFVATNAFLATNSTLGRPLAAGANGNVTLQLLEPYSKYLDRRNELDLRFGKVFRLRNGSRAVISIDLYNALNSDAVVGVNQAFATYLGPTEILNARVAKFTSTSTSRIVIRLSSGLGPANSRGPDRYRPRPKPDSSVFRPS